MTYSIIQKSQLEGAQRIDAEYYQPEYLNIRKTITKIGFFNLKDITFNFGSGENLKQTEDCQATKFIRTQNVRPILVDDNGLSFTEEKQFPVTNYGDLLFVRVGEGVGSSSVISNKFENSAFSDNVIRIKVSKVNPFYVSTLLNSRIGDLLMTQIKKGSARSLISKENLDSIKIPKIPEKDQKYFEEKINESEAAVLNSKNFYQQAEELLLEELGLKDFDEENKLFSIVNLSDCQKANRIDAEYFLPKYEKLVLEITNKNGIPLGNLASLVKGFEPGSEAYQEEGKTFIRVSSLSKDGLVDGDQKYLSEDLYSKMKDSYEPQIGEILLTKDASPGIAFAIEKPVEGIISGGILRLKTKTDIDIQYLALVLNSVVGRMQAERDAGGSIIAHWRPEQIKNILIPILPTETQKKISELVIKSHSARQKSKELLEQAKRKVEEIIEGKDD